MDRIAILGLGLIGGSIGLGLKAANLRIELVGHDIDSEYASYAGKIKAVDKVEWNIHRAVEGAAMVVIATPVKAVREILDLIRDDLQPGAIVTDTASTKAEVMRWADELLPPETNFVGGHPMAGKETGTIMNAEPTLFNGTLYCVTPSAHAAEGAIDSVNGMAVHLGATPFFIDAVEHDGHVAAISHLPMVLSTALTRLVLQHPARRELSKLAAGGFRDVSRLASQPPAMTRDIMLTNRENISRWIGAYIDELREVRDLINSDEETVGKTFDQANADRARWLAVKAGQVSEEEDSRPAISAKEAMQDMFLGRSVSDLIRRTERLSKRDSGR